MSRTYTFEAEIAKQAEFRRRYIEKPGVYTGKFTAAWYEQSKSGAECIKFKFVDDHGSQANNLAIYTYRGNGDKLSGYSLIQKIMACMRVEILSTRPDSVELFDYHSKQMVKQPRDVYPGLMGSIGLVLITEDYETRYEVKKQVIIHAVFEPKSRLMAHEIMSGIETPSALDELTQRMTEKNQWHKSLEQYSAPAAKQTQTENEFVSDDIPF